MREAEPRQLLTVCA